MNAQEIDEYLEGKHTRQLKKMLKSAYRIGGYWINHRDSVSPEKIKTVLNTREHVPTKAEGKQARREAAKRGR